jgi:ATP-dependent helicase/nuclease subunit B
LHILSLERLAGWVLAQLRFPTPEILDEQGRVMVLRGLLSRHRAGLRIFRASARLIGFAQQLSNVLGEFERRELTADALRQTAPTLSPGLSRKLEDFALILQEYRRWLEDHGLRDGECLLTETAQRLAARAQTTATQPVPSVGPTAETLEVGGIWVDGFTEFSANELNLLVALLPWCRQATFTFCSEGLTKQKLSWVSPWSLVNRTVEHCRKIFAALPGTVVDLEHISRSSASRFSAAPALAHLEALWARVRPASGGARAVDEARAPYHGTQLELGTSRSDTPLHPECKWENTLVGDLQRIRLVACRDIEGEAVVAAREILRHVRAGGRFRETAVLVRDLDRYYPTLVRTLTRFEIPLFLDRRESLAHHPLAEFTRGALRTIIFRWRHEDWFASLKTGLLPVADEDVDRLENEALARGWKGAAWLKLPSIPDDPELTAWVERLMARVLPPFTRLDAELRIEDSVTGKTLAAAIRSLWQRLNLEEVLQRWAETDSTAADSAVPRSVHATVWDQMNLWLNNLELGFSEEHLSLNEWLPIIEAGLAGLTVGLIPPGLDQVLIGSVDRSRDPEVQLALLLGLNEGIFPAKPARDLLLTDDEKEELHNRNVIPAWSRRDQLTRERFYAYTAFTRASHKLVVTHPAVDLDGSPLNRSPLLSQLRILFPNLVEEDSREVLDWRESEHSSELALPWLKAHERDHTLFMPSVLAPLLTRLRRCHTPEAAEALTTALARDLYGPVLRTSVSRIEQFAACPFRFFVHSGLRVEERKRFELDIKEQGSFQHDCLAKFHDTLTTEGKRWRDLEPAEARKRMAEIALKLAVDYRDGLLQTSEETRFLAHVMSESLQDFVEILVGWMRSQYRFDPLVVELPFGDSGDALDWSSLDLGNGHHLHLKGRIDRVDLYRDSNSRDGLCIVVDYKSSQKRLDPVLVHNGIQIQLLGYLNVLRHCPDIRQRFGVERLVPVGVFYVNLRGKYPSTTNRTDALAAPDQAKKLAYRHSGRFDVSALPKLDARDVTIGDQFNYRIRKDGTVYAKSQEALTSDNFQALLNQIENNLRRIGQQVFAGTTAIQPYRRGTNTPCADCDYLAICRFDPWVQKFRSLEEPDP